MASKQVIKQEASNYGVQASYCGTSQTMFIRGENQKVKSFLRICNLKGKTHYPFKIAQG